MAGSWLEAAWNNRHDPNFKADSKAFIAEHKVKPFHGAVIYFEGFQEEERWWVLYSKVHYYALFVWNKNILV